MASALLYSLATEGQTDTSLIIHEGYVKYIDDEAKLTVWVNKAQLHEAVCGDVLTNKQTLDNISMHIHQEKIEVMHIEKRSINNAVYKVLNAEIEPVTMENS